MKIEAAFVVSAVSTRDLPRDALAEIALVGRSNVGKSSLINALVRQRIARTSAAPGKTRLANVYRVRRGTSRAFYLVDLPGYGYARGDRSDIEAVAAAYFGQVGRVSQVGRVGQAGRVGQVGGDSPDLSDPPGLHHHHAALLLIDARHPGLPQDVDAWQWLQTAVPRCSLVATKIDKLSRAERLRAMKTNEAVFEAPVLSVSAATGEGLEELWKLIDRLTKDA